MRLGGGPPGLAPAAAAVFLAALGYCAPVGFELPASRGLASRLAFEDFHAAEGGFRWSRDASRVRFPEPGPGLPVRLELELSGWRPPGTTGPRLLLEAGGVRREHSGTRRFETLSLETRTSGWWSSDLVLELRSEIFRPGPHDARELGARVVAARLVPLVGAGLHRPPLRPLVWCGAAVLLLELLLAGLGVAAPLRRRTAWGAAVALGVGLWAARGAVAPGLGALVAALAALALLARLAPGPARRLSARLAEAGAAPIRGLRTLLPLPALGVAAAAVLAPAAAQLARPVVEVELGAGRAGPAAASFGALDSDGAVSFRQVGRGAFLDLRDLGGGPDWKITVRAALAAGPRELTVVRAGPVEVHTVLGPRWTPLTFEAPAPIGWRAGQRLEFPDAEPHLGLRVSEVRIDRGQSLPSPRLLAFVVVAALLAAAIPGTLGAGRVAALGAGLGSAALAGATLASEPIVASGFGPAWAAISLAGLALASAAAAVDGAARDRGAQLPRPALIGPALGFVAWLSAMSFPLYRGGHFQFHTGIAEEIWGGRFWIYYLPYPGSMLSRQAHWGDLVFPHPCSFHVLAAPLAALGHPAFHVAVKVLLALWLAGLALCAAILARRWGGSRAAVLAGAALPLIPASYQIVGLGHLMTLLGCFATAVALTFVTLRLGRLSERSSWWGAAALLGAALLSYFAAVPFLVVMLGLTLLWLYRRGERSIARNLLDAGLTGAGIAFALYYVNWAWPFLSESVPALMARGGTANEGSALSRLLLQPSKLDYTFGTLAVPLLAAVGLGWRVRGDDRYVLWPWMALLPIVSLLDVRFNFLLKHHYFTMVPVALGLGLLIARGSSGSRVWQIASAAGLVGLLLLATRLAADTAFGRIP